MNSNLINALEEAVKLIETADDCNVAIEVVNERVQSVRREQSSSAGRRIFTGQRVKLDLPADPKHGALGTVVKKKKVYAMVDFDDYSGHYDCKMHMIVPLYPND